MSVQDWFELWNSCCIKEEHSIGNLLAKLLTGRNMKYNAYNFRKELGNV